MAQSLEELARGSGDLMKEVDWNDLLAAVAAIVEGTGTVHVDPGESLSNAVAALPPAGGEVCLAAGTHELPEPLVISARSRIVLSGAGPSTIVRSTGSEAALVLDQCTEVTLSRLRVAGAAPATPAAAAHINGAVTVLGGADVTVSDCTLSCPDAAPRAQSCLTAGGGTTRLRVDRCRLEIGAGQIGALLVDPASAIVERSHAFLRPGAGPGGTTVVTADAGIVVGGTSVGTVRIVDNVIENVARGVHVGVSGRGVTPPPAADVVLISGNVVHLLVPAGHKRDRHAVFVGNARSISILDTIATARRGGTGITPLPRPGGPILSQPGLVVGLPTTGAIGTPIAQRPPAVPTDGIRVYGSFGPFLLVRGSSLRGFHTGVRVVPLAAPGGATGSVTAPRAVGAARGVAAPDTVEQARNRPAPAVKKAGPPARVILTPAVSSGARGAKQRIVATVVDLAGLRVPSVTVRFAVSGANAVPETGLTTDQNGEAAFEYTGANAGVDTVRAYADVDRDGVQDLGEPFASATHNKIAPDPATIVLDKISLAASTGAAVTLKATVRDATPAPLSGADVHFTVTGANPRADTVVKTDAAGVATFSYTGANQGTDLVSAFVASAAGERRTTATVTYLAPVPAKVVLAPAQGSQFQGGALTFTATVLDAANLPRPNVTVRFKVAGTHTTSGSGTTNAQGQATFTYSGTNAGSDQVTAFADVNNNGVQDVTDPFATASATFKQQEGSRVLVPHLFGLQRAEAELALTEAQLVLGRVTIVGGFSKLPLVVIDQDPIGGSSVLAGAAVNVTMERTVISDGPGGPILVESSFLKPLDLG